MIILELAAPQLKQKVKAKHTDGRFYPGVIMAIKGTKFRIKWDDGDDPLWVSEKDIKLPPVKTTPTVNKSPFKLKQTVLAEHSPGEWYTGVVKAIDDKTVTVAWDDGDTPSKLVFKKVRAVTEQEAKYHNASIGDDNDKLAYLKAMWRDLNKSKFGGRLTVPHIRFLKDQAGNKMRRRGQYHPSYNEIAVSRRLFNASPEITYETFLHEMCVAGDALIPTELGLVRMDQIQSIGAKYVLDRKGKTRIKKWWPSGTKKVFNVETENGMTLPLSATHPVLVLTPECDLVWRKVSELAVGDYLVQRHGTEFRSIGTELTKKASRLLGYLASEGSFTDTEFNRNCVHFGNSNMDLVIDFQSCWKSVFGYTPLIRRTLRIKSGDFFEIVEQNPEVCNWLEQVGFHRDLAPNKVVPHSVLRAGVAQQRQFLRAFIEGDGHIDSHGGIDISSASQTMLLQLKLMMLNLGIISKVERKSAVGTYNPKGSYWRLRTFDKMTSLEAIGVVSERRRERFEEAQEYHRNKTQAFLGKHWKIPFVDSWLRSLDTDYVAGIRRSTYGDMYPNSVIASLVNVDRLKIRRKLKSLIGDFTFEKVTAITERGTEPVYDMETGSHEFVANGFVVHNCHQAVYVIDKLQGREENQGHGPLWKAWMRKVGLNPNQFDRNSNDIYMTEEEREEKKQKVEKRQEEIKKHQPLYTLNEGEPAQFYDSKRETWVKGILVGPNDKAGKRWGFVTDPYVTNRWTIVPTHMFHVLPEDERELFKEERWVRAMQVVQEHIRRNRQIKAERRQQREGFRSLFGL